MGFLPQGERIPGGAGWPSVQNALQELLLQPVIQPLRAILNPGYFRYLFDRRLSDADVPLRPGLLEEAVEKLSDLLDGIKYFSGSAQSRERLQRSLRASLRLALSLPVLEERYPLPGSKKYQQAIQYLQEFPAIQEERTWVLLFGWLFLHNLGRLAGRGF